ncbi:hypothetical protein JM93_01263 [Roseibium hamelinense]|uniref:Killing trait domain-containing protein n=1 Tax=Roseibium hamelinense TaxID=150831 RepID=A0A562TAB2_9HYPH|nr:hypothetical protein [Roseibium hamelinense]MTI45350.1 hypothetical protein [Roseibium hamelinense]TWI90283.1 hypothetical protein JM93_01263 [Roseibium hamelinense]
MWLSRLFGGKKPEMKSSEDGMHGKDHGAAAWSTDPTGTNASGEQRSTDEAAQQNSDEGELRLARDPNGRLRPRRDTPKTAGTANSESDQGAGNSDPEGSAGRSDLLGKKPKPGSGSQNAASGHAKPQTTALNQQVVQAAEFSNYENTNYAPDLVVTPPNLMAGQTAGLAVQDAANYMNAIMQIAVAAQAVAIKKAAEGPIEAVEEVPLLLEVQKMVTAAVGVYGTVTSTAGQKTETFIKDINSSEA